jgi:hypothetical protein
MPVATPQIWEGNPRISHYKDIFLVGFRKPGDHIEDRQSPAPGPINPKISLLIMKSNVHCREPSKFW